MFTVSVLGLVYITVVAVASVFSVVACYAMGLRVNYSLPHALVGVAVTFLTMVVFGWNALFIGAVIACTIGLITMALDCVLIKSDADNDAENAIDAANSMLDTATNEVTSFHHTHSSANDVNEDGLSDIDAQLRDQFNRLDGNGGYQAANA